MSLATKLAISLAFSVLLLLTNIYQYYTIHKQSIIINKAGIVIREYESLMDRYEDIIAKQSNDLKKYKQYKFIKEQLSKTSPKKTKP